MDLFVIEQRRPVRQSLIQDRVALRIIPNRHTPPLLRDDMGGGEFQTVFKRSALLAHDVREIPHRRRIEINVERAGDDSETRELRAAKSGHERRVNDAEELVRQWSETRAEDALGLSSGSQHAPPRCLVPRRKDRADSHIADRALFGAKLAPRDDCKIPQALACKLSHCLPLALCRIGARRSRREQCDLCRRVNRDLVVG